MFYMNILTIKNMNLLMGKAVVISDIFENMIKIELVAYI